MRSRLVSLLALAMAAPALAQEPPRTSLPIPEQGFAGKVGHSFRDSDPATPSKPVEAPKGAPNIVVILLDDSGFGEYATFGGAVPSPTMERLAKEGLRFNRFHTAGICSPTRAALLTGRNPHNAGVGIVTELSTGYDGYTGVIPQSTAPVAKILRENGYATAMFGKNHNTPATEGGPAGPFNHWPNAFGFDYFYGFNAWGTSQFQPLLFENNRPVPPSRDTDYHLTQDLADRAISWVEGVKAINPDRPYFLYIATGANHAPHHAPQAWIDRFEGKFDGGWDTYRKQAFARQKALGVIPRDAKLTARPDAILAWDRLTAEQRRIYAHEMEVAAGFAAHTDHELGRVVDAVRAMPGGENTLIIYIAGDNGASAEGNAGGTLNEIAPANGFEKENQVTAASLAKLGSAIYNNNYPAGWAWAMNTPFQYYKQVVSHLGATRNPMIMSWPAQIKEGGQVRTQFADVTDIAPTLLAAAHVPPPASVDGVAQKPVDGVSLLAVTGDHAPEVRTRQYFEVFGNRAIYDKGWMASAKLADPWNPDRAALDPDKAKWELYDLDHDFTQARDLAARDPQRLEGLKALWWEEAKRYNVLPIDWRAGERLGRRDPDPRTSFTLYPGMAGIPEAIAPVIRNRSWTITAEGDFTAADSGMLITQGGVTGGWGFRLQNGRPAFDYNLSGADHFRIEADAPIATGSHAIVARFDYDGKTPAERGRGGTITLLVDGKEVATGRLPRTIPNIFSLNEGMDVGADFGSPVGDYPFPASFSGKLSSVRIDVK